MRRKVLLLTVIALLVLSNVGTYLIATGYVPWINQRGTLTANTPEYRSFMQVLGYIQRQFVDEVRALDDGLLVRGATRGMVEALDDPYSVYMDPPQYQQFMMGSIKGNYTGVGIEIIAIDGFITVIAPIKSTPAFRAGILPQDRIIAVDGQSVIGWTTQQASEIIRGTAGTAVVLTIRRGDAPQFDVEIVREVIQLRTVYSNMIEAGIGYLQISAFREDTARDAERALAALGQEGMKALILDLRDNPGGLLDQAVEVGGLFVGQGRVVSTVYRDGRREDHDVRGPGLGLPLIVLVNGASASASEIVAGAIQDRQAGLLLGTKTFGKAVVQHLFPLPDGGGLKLTTARYLTPNGHDINRADDGTGGISPDIEVQNDPVESGQQRVQLDDLRDPRNHQLRRALDLARERTG